MQVDFRDKLYLAPLTTLEGSFPDTMTKCAELLNQTIDVDINVGCPTGLVYKKLHGRSREQRYTKSADWEYIDHCSKVACPMPLFVKVGASHTKAGREFQRVGAMKLNERSPSVHYWCSVLNSFLNQSVRIFQMFFLYSPRYIPVGLLARVPQRLNERPLFYLGRDYLESLMASHNVGDWIKISEMLLGPVPSNFTLLPKHKANSYK
ncbi:UNVERIFIED_CONTAM: hypothetical protein FKN15_057910 [Acipenser sinensis]